MQKQRDTRVYSNHDVISNQGGTEYNMMLGSPAQSDNGGDNDDMVVIQQNDQRILQSEHDDSDNSLNRRSDKKNSMEKLKN